MSRPPRVMCCDIANRCGFTRNCKHATPHKPRQSCKTKCNKKLSDFKCVEVEICEDCEGKGYHYIKSKRKGQ